MLALLLSFTHLVVNATAQKCTITPVSPSELTSEVLVLKDGTPNVTIDCSCNDDKENAIMKIRWFLPDNSQVKIITKSPPGSPYYATSSSDTISTLIIPVFNNSYKGEYTCKPRPELEPVSNIQLSLGE